MQWSIRLDPGSSCQGMTNFLNILSVFFTPYTCMCILFQQPMTRTLVRAIRFSMHISQIGVFS